MKGSKDKALGLGRRIPRRDFLNGVAVTVGASLLPESLAFPADIEDFAPERAPGYYPPALTGLRGSQPGSFEGAHQLKDGLLPEQAPLDTSESYDLVVVGAGISGLSAAHFFKKAAGAGARVLILDNHDDFGGHARRNEFRHQDRLVVSYGGTWSIDSPAPYSAIAKGLISELGIEVSSFAAALDRGVYEGLESATFFDRETFGEDKLVRGLGRGFRTGERARGPDPAILAQAPLAEAAQRDILRLETEAFDPWPELASREKKDRLLRLSYADFLTKSWKLDARILPYYQTRPHGLFGVGIDAVSALDGWGLGFPGFDGMKLEPGYPRGMNRDAMRSPEAEQYFFHFPDGNASVARLLVRRLVPGALPGGGGPEVVTARADYAKLDDPGAPVRLRLNSTVVRVQNAAATGAERGVEVVYLRGRRLRLVRAKSCVLACWSVVIPYLCPELPEAQRRALAFAVKVPLVYTSVLLGDWKAFRKLAIHGAGCPGGYYNGLHLDLPVSVGGYRCARRPEDPIIVNLSRVPCAPGLPSARDQHRAGRQELLVTSFEEMERKTRDLLARVLGAGGFDPARDIRALTLNRWPHGYAYQYNALYDRFWVEGGETPCSVARRPFGRIFIANSDADAYAYTDCAIDMAHRAVGELLAARG